MTEATPGRRLRPGTASLALLLIGVITAGWWALALWPAGAEVPEWLARTRAACFGSTASGLPDLGGWILLIGQPLGMVGVLWAAWGEELKRDLTAVRASRSWSLVLAALGIAALAGVTLLGRRVAYAAGIGQEVPAPPIGAPLPISIDANSLVLTDQFGRAGSVAAAAGRSAMVTFAFGHCSTVCPTVVHDLMRYRMAAGREEVPIVVVSLDPWRDTPERLAGLAEKWQLAGHDRVLSGSVEAVSEVLDLLGIARSRDEVTGDIDHPATVMMLDDSGILVLRLEGGWDAAQVLLRDWPASLNDIPGS